MNSVYVYNHHEGFDIILSDRELTEEERYCKYCNRSDTLACITSDINDLLSMLSDHGITPDTAQYSELIERFNYILGGGHTHGYYSPETEGDASE